MVSFFYVQKKPSKIRWRAFFSFPLEELIESPLFKKSGGAYTILGPGDEEMRYSKSLFLMISLFSFVGQFVHAEEEAQDLYTIQFHDLPAVEFIRFVSKISKENFIFNAEDVNFSMSFSSGQPISKEQLIKALSRLLHMHELSILRENAYFVIHKSKGEESEISRLDPSELVASSEDKPLRKEAPKPEFCVYKLQYHEGQEMVESLKKIAGEGGGGAFVSQVIHTLQWIKATNSLLFSGEDQAVREVKKLIASLDVPLRQVFIEVLVIETDVQKGLEFGLQWAAGGKFQNRLGFGVGNFAPEGPHSASPSFTQVMQGVNASNPPTGLGQIPLASGFDLGVIGDIITHKGLSFLSLGSLVSALQTDTDSTIVLNQKIITQDNKNSKIFVGENIPFTGSVVTTVGQSQQSAANIEYRDVGVSLNITPILGEGEIITLNLDEEITEAVEDFHTVSTSHVTGIRTTKTNMVTHVHVPDRHFLVLSGMVRNAKAHHKAGIPCLGGLPWIGAMFSKNKEAARKRNVIIFVRPQIINSFEEYQKITQNQEAVYERQAPGKSFEEGLQVLPPAE